eukprot:TRINITY_DN1856_c0_g1_i11.p3 TRINITY_DN1856_c0_g1~~TRINITY_DN1856_c0_g1_i11.p3  ORF type:complete len:180 (-),score=6.30 TRINITY_DN1856_c0_g1_i11:948-1487(-)
MPAQSMRYGRPLPVAQRVVLLKEAGVWMSERVLTTPHLPLHLRQKLCRGATGTLLKEAGVWMSERVLTTPHLPLHLRQKLCRGATGTLCHGIVPAHAASKYARGTSAVGGYARHAKLYGCCKYVLDPNPCAACRFFAVCLLISRQSVNMLPLQAKQWNGTFLKSHYSRLLAMDCPKLLG